MNRIAEIQNKVFRKRKVIARRNYVYLYRSNDSIAAAVRSLIKFSSLFISIFLVVPRPTFFLSCPKNFPPTTISTQFPENTSRVTET